MNVDENIVHRSKREGFFPDFSLPMLSPKADFQARWGKNYIHNNFVSCMLRPSIYKVVQLFFFQDIQKSIGDSLKNMLYLGSHISERILGQRRRLARNYQHQGLGRERPFPFLNHLKKFPAIIEAPSRVRSIRRLPKEKVSIPVETSNPVFHASFKDCKCKFGNI